MAPLAINIFTSVTLFFNQIAGRAETHGSYVSSMMDLDKRAIGKRLESD